jgi:hypothetical protein
LVTDSKYLIYFSVDHLDIASAYFDTILPKDTKMNAVVIKALLGNGRNWLIHPHYLAFQLTKVA